MLVATTCPALPCLVHRPCPDSGINVLLIETRSNRAEYSDTMHLGEHTFSTNCFICGQLLHDLVLQTGIVNKAL